MGGNGEKNLNSIENEFLPRHYSVEFPYMYEFSMEFHAFSDII